MGYGCRQIGSGIGSHREMECGGGGGGSEYRAAKRSRRRGSEIPVLEYCAERRVWRSAMIQVFRSRWRGCRPCVDRLKKRKAQASAIPVVLMLKAAAITRTVSS